MHGFKPNKGFQKRVTVSANGKVMRRRNGKGHLNSGKSGRRLQQLRQKRALKGRFNWRALRVLGLD